MCERAKRPRGAPPAPRPAGALRRSPRAAALLRPRGRCQKPGANTVSPHAQRSAIGSAQKQPQAAVEPAPLLCKALQARSSSVSELSRWTRRKSALTPKGRLPPPRGDAEAACAKDLVSFGRGNGDHQLDGALLSADTGRRRQTSRQVAAVHLTTPPPTRVLRQSSRSRASAATARFDSNANHSKRRHPARSADTMSSASSDRPTPRRCQSSTTSTAISATSGAAVLT